MFRFFIRFDRYSCGASPREESQKQPQPQRAKPKTKPEAVGRRFPVIDGSGGMHMAAEPALQDKAKVQPLHASTLVLTFIRLDAAEKLGGKADKEAKYV